MGESMPIQHPDCVSKPKLVSGSDTRYRATQIHPGLLALTLIFMLLAAPARSHSDPPNVPPRPPGELNAEQVYPLRWSWIHWWEANRDPYLTTDRQDAAQEPDQAELEQVRSDIAAALERVLLLNEPRLRSEAAMALARLNEPGSIEPLIGAIDAQGTFGDNEAETQQVMQGICLGLGILDAPESELALTRLADQRHEFRIPAMAGMALLGDLQPETRASLVAGLRGDLQQTQLVMLALSRHATAEHTRWLVAELEQNPSSWVAAQIIAGLGNANDERMVPLLRHILLTPPANLENSPLLAYAAWRQLYEQREAALEAARSAVLGQMQSADAWRRYRTQLDQWNRLNPNRQVEEVERGDGPTRTMGFGLADIYISRLRASAAIALGQIGTPEALEALRAVLSQEEDRYSAVPMLFAMMALGEAGDQAALDLFADPLNPINRRGRRKSTVELSSPLRGTAALALGLYARPEETPQGLRDRPDTDRVLELLAQRLTDHNETQEVRAAAAMGLGLSLRTAALRPLVIAGAGLDRDEVILQGYVVLAMGLLGHQDAMPAAVHLIETEHRDPVGGLIARRAAALSLGLLGRRDALPLMAQAWHADFYTSREIIVALSMMDLMDARGIVMPLIQDPEDENELAFAVEAVGRLASTHRPDPIAGWTRNRNFTFRNDALAPLSSTANPFLFDYLIPSLGAKWY